MQLYEEYLTRHGIKDLKIAKHVEEGTVFYKSDSDHFWRVLWVKWMEPEIHPGHYVVRILKPRHNGGQSYNHTFERRHTHLPLFDNILRRDKILHWDEYEDFILGWSRTIDHADVAATRTSAFVAAWEMFLCCFDEMFAQSGCSGKFFSTVNPNLNEKQRYNAVQESLLYCANDIPLVYEAWMDRMDNYLNRRCGWLVKLVARNGS